MLANRNCLQMLILLYSDTNYVLDGFKAEFYVSNCPNNCTNQGKCINHQCVCQGDWIGKDCSLHACPENCGVTQGRGVCSKEHCRCLNVRQLQKFNASFLK